MFIAFTQVARALWEKPVDRMTAAGLAVVMAASLAGPNPAFAQTAVTPTEKEKEEEPGEPSAVIFMYHRFGEPSSPSTNIRLEQLDLHIEELTKERYNVRPLSEIVAKLKSGEPLEDRTIAITIDDAYRSVYDVAWPKLRDARIPFTIFVATDPIDHGNPRYMTWDELRELKKRGVEIGSQTKSHPHLPELTLSRAKVEIDGAAERIKAELGEAPKFFAYPYGELSLSIRELVAERGYDAAFGQNSGVAFYGMDRYRLPRFAMNETYGGIDRFRLAANALPLLVGDVLPADPVLKTNPPAFGFTVSSQLGSLEQLACFASGQGRLRLERLAQRVEVRLKEAFPPGRARINCTMPGFESRWRWFGIQFVIRR
jgi:peptidoglycan/xylan/chitin deacetylase (PgdA/CDA1 family)